MERDAHERWLQLSQEQQSVILAAAKEKGEPLSLPSMFDHTKLYLFICSCKEIGKEKS